MVDTFEIRILDAAPAMTETKILFTGTYKEAVAEAHKHWLATQRRVAVVYHMTYYHVITADGYATDKNTNSGVPEFQNCKGAA